MSAYSRLKLGASMFLGFALAGGLIVLGLDYIKPLQYNFTAFAWALFVAFIGVMWALYIDALSEAMVE